MPVFTWLGLPVLTEFQWTFNPALAFVGQGMIMGIRAGLSALAVKSFLSFLFFLSFCKLRVPFPSFRSVFVGLLQTSRAFFLLTFLLRVVPRHRVPIPTSVARAALLPLSTSKTRTSSPSCPAICPLLAHPYSETRPIPRRPPCSHSLSNAPLHLFRICWTPVRAS